MRDLNDPTLRNEEPAAPALDRGTIESCLDTLETWHELEVVALRLLDGELAESLKRRVGTAPGPVVKNGLLRWAVSDTPTARAHWEALARNSQDERLRDRERYVEELWRTVVAGPNQDLGRRLENVRGLLDAYRAALFSWFLQRFALGAAFRMYAGRWKAALLTWGWPGLVLTLSLVALLWGGLEPEAGLYALVLFAVGGVLAAWATGVPARALLQGAIPRLGAGVAIGYLFLAAAPDLVRLIVGWGRSPAAHYLLAGLVVATTWLYAWVHVLQRVQPTPPAGVIALRAWSLVWTAIAYGAAGLALSAPVLFSEAFLASGTASSAAPRVHTLLLTASLALALGVVLELAWEEKPLTEPL